MHSGNGLAQCGQSAIASMASTWSDMRPLYALRPAIQPFSACEASPHCKSLPRLPSTPCMICQNIRDLANRSCVSAVRPDQTQNRLPLLPMALYRRPRVGKNTGKRLFDMTINNDVVEAIGNTPLIKLKRASEETGCTILGKAEFMNPGQSVKDRAALYIIQDAVTRGTLRPGGTVVEGTAGNTGIGLTVVGNALGYHCVIVIPQTQSQEKKDALRLLGAHLVEVPALPYKNPNSYVHYSRRLADALAKTEPNGAIWANQWDNVANRRAHIETTSQEIWADTDGKVDGFVSAVGSGGTLGGVSDGLKAKRKSIQIALADVP